MRVLSLDLDFFLSGMVTNRADDINSRPDDYGLIPWQPDKVTSFLENSLNLNGARSGKVVSSHHEVFYAWRELINADALKTPFFVCHVDAHSDLGMGLPSWVYLHSDFLELPLTERQFPHEGSWGLNFGSFMSFAIGNRWISGVDFIAPTFWRDDIPRYQLAAEHIRTDGTLLKANCELEIELMHAPRDQIQIGSVFHNFLPIRRSVGEPLVPFNIIAEDSVAARYSDQNWDFVFLSHSPGYVPSIGDSLLPVIANYINDL